MKILIVDDDEHISRVLSLILEEEGYETDTASSGKEAIEKSEKNVYNLAILDIRLPDIEGTELLKTMRETKPRMIKIMLTGYPQLENAVKALNNGADAYLLKPVDPDKLLETIEGKLEEQEEDKTVTEEKMGLFLKTRTEKFLQELR